MFQAETLNWHNRLWSENVVSNKFECCPMCGWTQRTMFSSEYLLLWLAQKPVTRQHLLFVPCASQHSHFLNFVCLQGVSLCYNFICKNICSERWSWDRKCWKSAEEKCRKETRSIATPSHSSSTILHPPRGLFLWKRVKETFIALYFMYKVYVLTSKLLLIL